MRRPALLLIACAFQTVLLPAQASAAGLGATLQQIKAEYAQAESSTTGAGAPVLRLRNIAYGGIQWSDVQFNFGPGRRLQSLTMKTRAISYEGLMKLVTTRAEMPDDASSFEASTSHGSGMQMRVCDEGDGSVSLTYEAATTPA